MIGQAATSILGLGGKTLFQQPDPNIPTKIIVKEKFSAVLKTLAANLQSSNITSKQQQELKENQKNSENVTANSGK